MRVKKELTVKFFAVFKVLKTEEEVEELEVSPTENVKNLISDNILDLLRKRLGSITKNYELPDNSETKNHADRLLTEGEERDFKRLAKELSIKYKNTTRSRKGVILIVNFEYKGKKYLCIFKFPTQEAIGIREYTAEYLKEVFRKYEKGFIYPSPTADNEVRITQKNYFSKYALDFWGIETEKSPEEFIADLWREQGGNISLTDIKQLFSERPDIKELPVSLSIGEYTFKIKLGQVDEVIGKIESLFIAILLGQSAFLKVKKDIKIDLVREDLENVQALLRKKGLL